MADSIPFEKVERDGKIAVLVSPGFGAGWSTWGSPSDFLAFDSRLVEMAERKAPDTEVEALLGQIMGEEHTPYTGGWRDITVEWLPKGERFYIHEYDGSEHIVNADSLVMTA